MTKSLIPLLVTLWSAAAPAAPPPYYDHTTYDIVLGQQGLTSRRVNGTTPLGLNTPSAVAVDRFHSPTHFYLADLNNARVLGWNDINSARTGAPPDLVIGQPDLITSVRYRGDIGGIARPVGLAVAPNGTLYVADQRNGRVVGFKYPFDPSRYFPGQSPSQINFTADWVLGPAPVDNSYTGSDQCNPGQPTTPGKSYSNSSPTTVCFPTGLGTDSLGDLFIADKGNHRVLVFLADKDGQIGLGASFAFGPATLSGIPGDPTAATCPLAASPSSLCLPSGVFVLEPSGGAPSTGAGGTPGSTLYIADNTNGRILAFNNATLAPTMDVPGMFNPRSADHVYGQTDFTSRYNSNDQGHGPSRLLTPSNIAIDVNNVMWIGDNGNVRVVGVSGFVPPFSTPVTELSASFLIGQPDFYSFGYNVLPPNNPDPYAPPATGGTLFQQGNTLSQLAVDPAGRLFVPDAYNHRVLAFDNPAQSPVANAALGQLDDYHAGVNRPSEYSLELPGAVAADRAHALAAGEPIHIYIADFGNSRVLGWWDLGALTSGKGADVIIGQVGPHEYACNGHGPVSPTSLCWPRGVAVDSSGDLWVADSWNNRVVRFPQPFKQAQKRSGAPVADLALGQTSLRWGLINEVGFSGAGVAPSPTARSLWKPTGVAIDEDSVAGTVTVWVADRDNDRVVGYQATGWRPGTQAAFHSGMQAQLLLAARAVGSFKAPGCPDATDPSAVCMPTSVAVDENHDLWVADRLHNRVALYDHTTGPMINPTPIAGIGVPDGVTLPDAVPPAGQAPTQTLLNAPEAISLLSGPDGATQAVVVGDSANHRVLIFNRALPAGTFLPAADQQVGQADFDSALVNRTPVYVQCEIPTNLQIGLQHPGGVLALPEALFISEGGFGGPRRGDYGDYHTANATSLTDFGNHRVVVIKTGLFPAAGAPEPPIDGGVQRDLASPPDLSVAVVPDMAQVKPVVDLAQAPQQMEPQVHSGGCSATGAQQTELPWALWALGAAGLLTGALLRRRRA